MSTKNNIIQTAILVFNEQGFGATTLLDIANKLSISRGNLAYHFRDKSSLLSAIADQLKDEIDEERKKRKDYPAFVNLQIDIKSYYKLQKKYRFIFENNTVLHHQPIRRVMKEWANITIQEYVDAFAFAIHIGNMKPEPLDGMYYNLAVNTWMLVYFWLAQKEVRDSRDPSDAEKMVWSLILPHFTEKGMAAFTRHFGKEFILKLGEPFETTFQDISLF